MKLKCFNVIKINYFIIMIIIIIKIGFSWEFSLKIQHCCK